MCYRNWFLLLVGIVQMLHASAQSSCALVMNEEGVVPYAVVSSAGQRQSVLADSSGYFCWPTNQLPRDLQVHLPGNQTLFIPEWRKTTNGEWELFVAAKSLALSEVAIIDRAASTTHSIDGSATTVYSASFFESSRSTSIAEILQMVTGIQPQVNCAVCATTDLQLNGLPGAYTLVLINGMPVVSGLATVYSFAAIPASMIERVEVTRGPATAMYGSEAMAGMINIVLRTEHAPQWQWLLGTSDWGEHTADVAFSKQFNKWYSTTSVSAKWLPTEKDQNDDGFTDVPLQQRIAAMQQWKYARPFGRTAQGAVRWLNEHRWGGQMTWTPDYRGSDIIYGESIRTQRVEAFFDYQLPVKTSLVVQHSTVYHRQDAWYGPTPFGALQWTHFSQLLWRTEERRGWQFTSGVAHRTELYDDNSVATADADGQNVAPWQTIWSVFSQGTWKVHPRFSAEPGLRLDLHPIHGLVPSPRCFVRYATKRQRVWKAGFAKGFRTVSVFTEDHAALTGARNVVMAEALRPETSWSTVVQFDGAYTFDRFDADVEFTGFYTHFYNRIVADYLTDPNAIIYQNLDGYGISRGAVLNTTFSGAWPLTCNVGVMYNDVFLMQQQEQTPLLFAPKWSGTFQLNARLRRGFTCSTSGEWRGSMHLPVQEFDPRPANSPTYLLWHLQVKKAFSNGQTLIIGVRNLLDFTPQLPILRSFDPFDRTVDDTSQNPHGHTFDASYSYAPMQGRTLFLSWSGCFGGKRKEG